MATPKRRSRRSSGGDTSVQIIKYAIVKAIRRIYSMYHPARKEVIEAAKIKVPRIKKDGTESVLYEVYYHCAKCHTLNKEYDVDHIQPVGALPSFPYAPGELESWINRLFCPAENLQLLCKPCHKTKTATDRRQGVA